MFGESHYNCFINMPLGARSPKSLLDKTGPYTGVLEWETTRNRVVSNAQTRTYFLDKQREQREDSYPVAWVAV